MTAAALVHRRIPGARTHSAASAHAGVPRSPSGPAATGTAADLNRWAVFAECRSADPALFFGRDYERGRERAEREQVARSYCARCPVSASCLAWALTLDECGIWAGTNDEERAELQRGRAQERRVSS